ncbi:SDR family oxidoreductase [Streptomyces sp. NPDC001719]
MDDTGEETANVPPAGEFNGKIVLVTGGGRGVGGAVSQRFAALGAHVIINYFHGQDQAAACLEEISAAGGSAELLRASVARRRSVEDMFARIRERHGGLDVLVNNAAYGVVAPTSAVSDRAWNQIFDTNLHGARWCSLGAAALMEAHGGGAIVNMSSIGSQLTVFHYTAIGVSKAALEALTRYLAVEFAPLNIRVNAASSGLVDNHVAALWPGDAKDVISASAPLGGLATEGDLANIVTYLASPGSRWITGQTVVADGGLSLGSAMVSPPRPSPALNAPKGPAPVHAAATGDAGTPSADIAQTVARPAVSSPSSPEVPLVAVVGMGVQLPHADSPEALWDLLHNSESVFSEPGERFDIDRFFSPDPKEPDCTYARVSGFLHPTPEQPSAASRATGEGHAQRWLEHCIRQALTPVTQRPEDRYGCYIGQWTSTGQQLEESLAAHLALQHAHPQEADSPLESPDLWELIRSRLPRADSLSSAMLPHTITESAAYNVLPRGTEVLSLDTACSSSLYAIDLGARKLLAGQRDIVLCGGVEELEALIIVLFSKLGGLSRRADVRPFDRAADGTLFTDAACVVALKTLTRAQADGDRILGVLTGFGGASDGRGKAIYAPNTAGQSLAMARARAVNGLQPQDIDWILAHATGTVAGDTEELATLDRTMTGHPVVVTADKSRLGHTGWAAGAVSVVHALLALQHSHIPAQQRFQQLTPATQASSINIPRDRQPWPARADRPRTAGISGFGFGGTNAHLIVRDRPAKDDRSVPPLADEPMVLTGWTAFLPGAPSPDTVRRWLSDNFPPDLTFGPHYPSPPFTDVRISPRAVLNTDRTQLMSIQAVEQFRTEHDEPWAALADRTGVFSTYLEPPRLFESAVVRAYRKAYHQIADDLAAAGHTSSAHALRTFTQEATRTIPQISEDTLPGLMPNVVAGRIANRFNLRGPSMAVGAGRDSALAALNVAEHYLRNHDLDMALVIAACGNATPWAAHLTGTAPAAIAEGAFLLVLTRQSLAHEHQLPVLARLRTGVGAPHRATAGHAAPAVKIEADTSFLSADGAVALLRALQSPAEHVLIEGRESDLAVTIEAPQPEAGPDGPVSTEQATTGKAVGLDTKPDPLHNLKRTGAVLAAAAGAETTAQRLAATEPATPGVQVGPDAEPIPPHSLVLTGDTDVAARLAQEADSHSWTVVCTDGRNGTSNVHALGKLDESCFTNPVKPIHHIRLITPIGSVQCNWPQPPPTGIVRLHEAYFLAAKAYSPQLPPGGSIACLLLDALTDSVTHPYASLFTGTTRALSRELPDHDVFAVLTSESDLEAGLGQLGAESTYRRQTPVARYRDGIRYLEEFVHQPVSTDAGPLSIDDTSVIVAAGGARGITARCLLELAQQTRPKRIWILGTTPLPDAGSQPDEHLGDEEPPSRKEFLRRRLAASGGTPARHNAEFDQLLRVHEVHTTLTRLREILGEDRVNYLTCNVTQGDQVAAAARQILAEDHHVDLMLFAAGITRSASVHAKTLADFRAVVATKVTGYHTIRKEFGDSTTTWCSFSSLSVALGLPGETDYVAGNDYLNTAASYPPHAAHREFAIAWPAWKDTGILAATPLIQAAAARRSENTPLPPCEGTAHFLHELASGRPDEAVSYYAGKNEQDFFARRAVQTAPSRIPQPRQDSRTPGRFLDHQIEADASHSIWRTTLTPERDAYLLHHQVLGKPTMPATIELEMAAQAATALIPGTRVHAFTNMKFSSFLQLHPGRTAPPCHISARLLHTPGLSARITVRITSDVVHPNGTLLRADREHARVDVVLIPSDHAPIPPHTLPRRSLGGTEVTDPYTGAQSAISLSGPFAALTRCRTGPQGNTADLRLSHVASDSVLSTFRVPSIALDALLRTAALRPAADRWHTAAAPVAIDHIGLYTTANDALLSTQHDTPLTLHAEPLESQHSTCCSAITEEGQVLLRITGLTTHDIGGRTIPGRNERPVPAVTQPQQ